LDFKYLKRFEGGGASLTCYFLYRNLHFERDIVEGLLGTHVSTMIFFPYFHSKSSV
jgi:hypothetical protein